jgi:hypothetical protein
VVRQKALRLPAGFESAHLSFSHPGLMRNLGAIVGILLGVVSNTRQDRSTGSTIALQLVGDDPEWFLALTAQQSAKEPLSCTLIAARLQQNIDDITVLIHGTPKIMLLAVDSDEEFVQMPSITEASLFLLETSGNSRGRISRTIAGCLHEKQ